MPWLPARSDGPSSTPISGLPQGMDDAPVGKVIRAEVPLAEMFGYATDLRSMSQGRAVYSMEFEKYAKVPQSVADTIIKKG